MRIIVNLDRPGKKFRIRCGYDCSSKDDVTLHNCGLELYEQWKRVLEGLESKRTEIVFEGERK